MSETAPVLQFEQVEVRYPGGGLAVDGADT
jgi:hypothetical protein